MPSQGIFHLSRARYSMGASRVGRLQYDARPMTATALLAVDQAQPVHLALIPPVRGAIPARACARFRFEAYGRSHGFSWGGRVRVGGLRRR